MRRPSWLVLAQDRPETLVGLANFAVMAAGGLLLGLLVLGWWALAAVGGWWLTSLTGITLWRVRRRRWRR